MNPLWPGHPYPLGATFDGSGVNFALFSEVADKVEVCLIADDNTETRVELTEVDGHVWHGYLTAIEPGQRGFMRSFSRSRSASQKHHSLLSPAPGHNAPLRAGTCVQSLRLLKRQPGRSTRCRTCDHELCCGGWPRRLPRRTRVRSASGGRPAMWSRAVRPARVRQTARPRGTWSQLPPAWLTTRA